MKTSIGVLLLALFTIQSFKTFDNDFYTNQQIIWKTVKSAALEVAETMPADKYSYQPTDTIRTFGAQMNHIAYSTGFLLDMFIMGKPMKFEEPDASKLSKADIIKMMKAAFVRVDETMKSVSKEQLAEQVEFPPKSGRMLTKAMIFDFLRDHITNHRAKANLYIRMVGVKPPRYAF